MHASSLENMQKCYERYIIGGELETRTPLKVLDVGGAEVNGSYSEVFCGDNVQYLGADLQAGPGVSVVLDDPNKLPLDDNSVDIVISGQMLEHCEFFWIVFTEMVRVLKHDGFIFLIAPSAGPIHKYPVDCYRFYPDAYRALAKYADCYLVDIWHDNRGPWNDLVGVFSKSNSVLKSDHRNDLSLAAIINSKSNIKPTRYDKSKGETPYIDILKKLHDEIEPQSYLEIGVRHGASLSLARCKAVGIDPEPDVKVALSQNVEIVKQKSDDFFASHHPFLDDAPELVFIDGMHLVEYVLRDFMNIEKVSGPNTIIVVDDIFPNHPRQANRSRDTQIWTGDVWKLYSILKNYRPELTLIPIDSSPTGLLLVAGLDSKNRILSQNYNPIIREAGENMRKPGAEILRRSGAISSNGDQFQECIQVFKDAKARGQSLKSQQRLFSEILDKRETVTIGQKFFAKAAVVPIAFQRPRKIFLKAKKWLSGNSENNGVSGLSRSFNSEIPSSLLSDIQNGVQNSQYRGISLLKSPFDIGIYLQLLSKQNPRTIIEVGSKFGGSALWFADMLSASGLKNPKVISIDIEPLAEFTDDRIEFLQGDAARLDRVLTGETMDELLRPITVIEDSSHLYDDSLSVLEFFHPFLQTGDYIIVEDGVVSQLPEQQYERYQDGPNRAVSTFLDKYGSEYEIATELCDHYGFNTTYNPNGYLRKL